MRIDWMHELPCRVSALGDAPTDSQIAALKEWIMENVPRECLHIAALDSVLIPSLYCDLTERMGEMGI